MRYWAMSLAAAICGGFIAIERFAFAPTAAVWVAFGVAIAATVFCLTGYTLALLRADQTFSGLSALGALVAGWTIIAMRTFSPPSALWLAFAAGVLLLLLSLRALALHETTVERVVHALQRSASAETPLAAAPTVTDTDTDRAPSASKRPPLITPAMHSWTYWLTHTCLALAGAFVVLITFALTAPGHPASPRWIAFGIGIATTCLALSALAERLTLRDPRGGGYHSGRLPAIGITAASAGVAIALIVTMILLSGSSAQWVAFALGCGMVGLSLLALAIHELTSERVRHELEIAEPTAIVHPQPSSTA
jgi:hypothetical protein